MLQDMFPFDIFGFFSGFFILVFIIVIVIFKPVVFPFKPFAHLKPVSFTFSDPISTASILVNYVLVHFG